jgi:hypothetical protein
MIACSDEPASQGHRMFRNRLDNSARGDGINDDSSV